MENTQTSKTVTVDLAPQTGAGKQITGLRIGLWLRAALMLNHEGLPNQWGSLLTHLYHHPEADQEAAFGPAQPLMLVGAAVESGGTASWYQHPAGIAVLLAHRPARLTDEQADPFIFFVGNAFAEAQPEYLDPDLARGLVLIERREDEYNPKTGDRPGYNVILFQQEKKGRKLTVSCVRAAVWQRHLAAILELPEPAQRD